MYSHQTSSGGARCDPRSLLLRFEAHSTRSEHLGVSNVPPWLGPHVVLQHPLKMAGSTKSTLNLEMI